MAENKLQKRSLAILRYSLAAVFLWFGILKLVNASPVVNIIAKSYPIIVDNPVLYMLLALFEIAIGIGILIPRFVHIASWVMVLHLALATLGVLFSPQAFNGGFPVLSVTGEFVVKNFVLIAGALVVADKGKEDIVII